MPVLDNPKHERFAQALATGITAVAAYRDAGYAGDDGNASRLAGDDDVRARVAELLEAAAAAAILTVEKLTGRLVVIADVAMETGVVEGEPDEYGKVKRVASTKHLQVARQAIMDVAKLNGLVVDKAVVAGDPDRPLVTELKVEFV